jgi:hypothetical protein
MALNRIDLERAVLSGCEVPLCDHKNHERTRTLYLHGRCHLGAKVDVSYTSGSGVVLVACAICKKLIAEIKVADE